MHCGQRHLERDETYAASSQVQEAALADASPADDVPPDQIPAELKDALDRETARKELDEVKAAIAYEEGKGDNEATADEALQGKRSTFVSYDLAHTAFYGEEEALMQTQELALDGVLAVVELTLARLLARHARPGRT